MKQSLTNQRGNSTILMVVGGVILIGVLGVIAFKMSRSEKMMPSPSMQPQSSTESIPPSVNTSASPSPQAMTKTGSTDTQLDNDIKALDQQMGKMDTEVSQSQTVPVEPAMN